MGFVFRNLTKVDSSPVVSNNVSGTKVGRKGDGKRKTRSLPLAYSLPITLCALILPVSVTRALRTLGDDSGKRVCTK